MMRYTNPILSMFLGSMLMLAQACDQSPAGEKIAAKPDPGQNIVEVEAPKDEPIPAPSVDEKPTSGDDAPVLPPPPAGRPGVEIPNNGPGYGGGSQGALQPVPTGDEDDEENDDFGICGNGEQEVLRNTNKNCPHLLYGTTIAQGDTDRAQNGTSTLVYFNVGTGQGFNVATITGINNVSAIDFSPQGDLYGVGTRSESPFESVFAKIDCQTGEATIIGPTQLSGVGETYLITDINFDSQGQLWAYLVDDQFAGTINFSTGVFTAVSTLPIAGNTQGNGLAFFPFPNDQLYTAGNANLVLINESNGTGAIIHPLTFPSLSSPFINAMDNDPLNNILYVSIASDDQNNLGVLDITTGNVSLIGTTPIPAPDGLDGLAVNRHYEECDTQAVGVTECIDCVLHEVACADAIDDDFDGLIDCADPDCLDRPCDDVDACTLGDTCTPVTMGDSTIVVCLGQVVVCNDDNPCTIDECCDPNPDSPHFCGSIRTLAAPDLCIFSNDPSKENVLGSCELDGRACTVGKCALPPPTEPPTPNPTFICFETDRKFIPIETAVDVPNFGCLDDNQCTADSCVESWTKEGFDSNGNASIAAVPWGSTETTDAFGNVILDNDWHCEAEVMPERPCLDPITCREGICTLTGTGMPGNPSNVECVPEAPRPCDGDLDCNAGLEICLLDNCAIESCVESHRFIFVTSTVQFGDFGGLAAADAICQARAAAAVPPLPGTYKAWLSDSTTSANSRLTHSLVPYLRPDGVIVALSYADLINTGSGQPLLNPIDVNEFGVKFLRRTWTGTNADGTASGFSCNNWTNATNQSAATYGGDIFTDTTWTNFDRASCNIDFAFYCLQQ